MTITAVYLAITQKNIIAYDMPIVDTYGIS